MKQEDIYCESLVLPAEPMKYTFYQITFPSNQGRNMNYTLIAATVFFFFSFFLCGFVLRFVVNIDVTVLYTNAKDLECSVPSLYVGM